MVRPSEIVSVAVAPCQGARPLVLVHSRGGVQTCPPVAGIRPTARLCLAHPEKGECREGDPSLPGGSGGVPRFPITSLGWAGGKNNAHVAATTPTLLVAHNADQHDRVRGVGAVGLAGSRIDTPTRLQIQFPQVIRLQRHSDTLVRRYAWTLNRFARSGSTSSRSGATSSYPAPPWCRTATRRSSSPAPAWCSSSPTSWARPSRPRRAWSPSRSASAPATSTASATPPTSPSSRCWATSASATTSRRRPSIGPGSW